MGATQTSDILRYMRRHPEGITQRQAAKLFGATRLSSIIFNLKAQGHRIETVIETERSRYGRTARYGRYVLVDESE